MIRLQQSIAIIFATAGAIAAGIAVRHERQMQRHRLPGVSYAEVTFRRDGGWRRSDLFAPEGLAHQRQASRAGVLAAGLWLVALASWVLLAG